MTPKRVLIFSLTYYPRFVGGAEVAIKEITDRISSSEIEFDIITLRLDKNLPRKEKIGNITVHRIGFSKPNPTDEQLLRFPLYFAKILYAPMAFWKAKKLDREHKYDILWAMMSYMGFPALFFKWFRRNIPFVLSLQEGDTVEHVTKRVRIQLVGGLYKKIFKKASVVQVISTYLGDFAKSMGFSGAIEVIPNGVDIAHFSKRASDTELFALKEKLNKKYTDTFIITTSRLVPKNAIADLINSLKFLPAEMKLLIVGNGPQENELKELALRENLNDRIYFLGYIPHEKLIPYLNVSDIFVRPSLSEGLGNSFLEAMAAELPVIGTPVGGIVDFLQDKRTGMFCNVHDPKSIALAVQKIQGNINFRNTLVLNAKQMVTDEYDWALIARKMRSRIFDRAFDIAAK